MATDDDKRMVEVCIVHGVEGPCLSVNDTRVAGPKPWGGGRVGQTFRVSVARLLETLEVPHG